MKNIIYIATSLDGYIATPDGGVDWLHELPNPDQSDFGFAEFMSGIDALIMGRNTFEMVLSFGEWVYNKPVFVLSNTLKEIPASVAGKAQLISGSLPDVLTRLNADGFNNLYIDGGKTIQSFLHEGLIDEMVITRVPILLGDGIPLFEKLAAPVKLRHIGTETFENGLVKSHYATIRADEESQ